MSISQPMGARSMVKKGMPFSLAFLAAAQMAWLSTGTVTIALTPEAIKSSIWLAWAEASKLALLLTNSQPLPLAPFSMPDKITPWPPLSSGAP